MLVVVGVMLGMLLSALDQTIVGTALPRIIVSLGGMSLYSWVATSYMLSSTATMPIFVSRTEKTASRVARRMSQALVTSMPPPMQ